MSSLTDVLLKADLRPQVVEESVRVIDAEVESKSGLTGLAVKGAYALVKAVKPGFVREAVDQMLDDFVARLNPFYAAAQAEGQPIGPYLNARAGEVADALLGVTDARAQRASNQGVKKAYEKLRPTAKKHVEAAVPAIGRMVAKYAPTAQRAAT